MAGPYRILVSETGEIAPYTGWALRDCLTEKPLEEARNRAADAL